MWPTAFALVELTASDEARIAALVKRAVASGGLDYGTSSTSRLTSWLFQPV